jgi:CDP-glucose 4,6-dehydratase
MESMVNEATLRAAFAGKKVFVTGHTGFKGTWLLHLLHQLGAIIKGYALQPPNDTDAFYASHAGQHCENVLDDIRNQAALQAALLSFGPDFIFHMAAQPLVRRSYEDTLYTYEVNAMGTANLLEALKALPNACTCVVITTDKVYENKETGQLFDEDDRLGGYDPYSASKACAEIITASYRNAFFNPMALAQHQKHIGVARAGNVIGGGDWNTDRIIPDIVQALHHQQTISVRNPTAVRPWQHVLEPLVGYLMYALYLQQQRGPYAEAINFGPYPTDCLQVETLVQKAIQHWGHGNYQVTTNPHAPHEAQLLLLRIERAKAVLGWEPLLQADGAIQLTMHWFRHYLIEQQPAQDLMLQDIRFYFDLLNNPQHS